MTGGDPSMQDVQITVRGFCIHPYDFYSEETLFGRQPGDCLPETETQHLVVLRYEDTPDYFRFVQDFIWHRLHHRRTVVQYDRGDENPEYYDEFERAGYGRICRSAISQFFRGLLVGTSVDGELRAVGCEQHGSRQGITVIADRATVNEVIVSLFGLRYLLRFFEYQLTGAPS